MANSSSYSLSKGITLQLFSSAEDIPVAQWNKLKAALPVFLSKDYLAGLENSWQKNHRFVYVIVFENEIPFAAFYFQAIDLTTLKIGSVIHAEPYGKFLKLISDKITKSLINTTNNRSKWLLVNGNMCSSGSYGIVCSIEKKPIIAKHFGAITKKVIDSLNEFGDVSVRLVKDFKFEDDYLFTLQKEEGYIRFVMDPVMMLKIDPSWKSFDDYLKALSSKYRLRTVTVLEKVAGMELKELNADEILKLSSKLDQIYQEVIGKSPVRIVHPDINYIYNVKVRLQDKFIFKCWFLNREPVAFYTFLLGPGETEAHHIGINYHFNKTHALYQNILYSLVADSIKNKSNWLNFGRTAMEMKSTVGAVPVNYAAYIKLESKVLNHLLKPFLPSQPPSGWVQRDPFKKV